MPTYAYECAACGHRFEEFQSMTAAPLVKCPSCSKRKLQRLIGAGAGVIFKGSGFYQTDYKKSGAGKPSEGATDGTSTDKSNPTKTDTAASSPSTDSGKSSAGSKPPTNDKGSGGASKGKGK